MKSCGIALRAGCFCLTFVNMIPVQVECYAGYKGNERPLRFTLGSRVIEVEAVEDQWHSPDITYFRIRANDEKTYILKHHEGQDQWSLEVYDTHH